MFEKLCFFSFFLNLIFHLQKNIKKKKTQPQVRHVLLMFLAADLRSVSEAGEETLSVNRSKFSPVSTDQVSLPWTQFSSEWNSNLC